LLVHHQNLSINLVGFNILPLFDDDNPCFVITPPAAKLPLQ